MTWSLSQRKRFLTWLAVTLAGGIIGYVYTIVAYPATGAEAGVPLRGLRAGLIIGGLTAAFEVYGLRTRLLQGLNGLSIPAALFLRIAILTVLVVVALRFSIVVTELVEAGPQEIYRDRDFFADTVFSMAALSAIIFVLQMKTLIGGRTLANLLVGRYHRPMQEDRIFAFVDLVGSTTLASTLGPQRFHNYVSELFGVLDDLIVDHGGEIHAYVGDAIIATWPLTTPAGNARSLACALAAMDECQRLSARFVGKYGQAPRLRAALHGGPVVAGECGSNKRQITYLGDTVNVTARLEQVSKATKVAVIASSWLIDHCDLPTGIRAVQLGAFELKGLGAPVSVFDVHRGATTKDGGTGPSPSG